MGYEFKLPDVGDGISEGKLIKWLVAAGDEVKEDQPIAEVETDKAVVEITAPNSGKIESLIGKEGDTIDVGDAILIFAGEGEVNTLGASESAPAKEEAAQEAPAPAAQPGATPAPQAPPKPAGDILILPKDRIFARDNNIDLTQVAGTGKDGRITEQDLQAALGKGTATAAPAAQASAPAPQPAESQAPAPATPQPAPQTGTPAEVDYASINAPPSVRKRARELGIDLSKVTGTGPAGQVSMVDLTGGSPAQPTPTAQPGQAPASAFEHAKPNPADGDEIKEFSTIRKAIAKNMTKSMALTTQVTQCDDADVTELVAVRKREKEKLAKQGVKITFLPFIMKAVVATMRKFPVFNALHYGDDAILMKKDINLGIAVDASDGLRVAVIKNADQKSMVQLAQELQELAEKTRENKLTPADMQGGTFTITSVGSLGGTYFTPIINYPEVAILGIGKITKKPTVVGKDIVPRDIMTISTTFDHNVIDGAEAARFTTQLIEYLEDPELLLVESV